MRRGGNDPGPGAGSARLAAALGLLLAKEFWIGITCPSTYEGAGGRERRLDRVAPPLGEEPTACMMLTISV